MKNKYQGSLAAGHELAWSQTETYFTFKIQENSLLTCSGKENKSLAEKP